MWYQAFELQEFILSTVKHSWKPISAAAALTEESGLAYILLYSPLVQCTKSFICEPDMNTLTDMNSIKFEFSEEELDLFEEWFEEGTEVTDDGRYNAWLARFYPTSPLVFIPHHRLHLACRCVIFNQLVFPNFFPIQRHLPRSQHLTRKHVGEC